MSAYKQQEYDFVERTRKIIYQYDDYFKDKDISEKFEVTLLINSFVGLLVLPHQEWYNLLPEEIISKGEWGIDVTHIGYIKNKKDERKSVKEVATHLRNSVAHYYFTAFENKKNEISQIQFLDYTDHTMKTKTFEATIPIANIRKFLDKFSQTMIDKMNESK